LAHDLATGTIQAGINTGVGTAINGGNLGDNLIANLHSTAVSVLGANVAQEIGAAYKGGMDYVAHKIAHAALGGAMDVAMGGDGASGAIGGVVGEITGEILMNQIAEALLTGQIDPKRLQNWTDAGVDLSKLVAGFAAAVAGGDVDIAANAGGNAVQNNSAAALRALVALERMAPSIRATMSALFVAGLISLQEVNEKLRQGAEVAIAWIKEQYQGLTDEQKRLVTETPGLVPPDTGDLALPGYGEARPDVDTGSFVTLPPDEDALPPLIETIPIEEQVAEDYVVTQDKPTIHDGQQGKHIQGHNNYIPGRSKFSHPNPQGLVDEWAGKGQQIGSVPVGEPGSKERIDFGVRIGVHVAGDKELDTTIGIIHYGNSGKVHIVPGKPK